MEERKPKVLITYVEAGMGHIVSAKAIAEALTAKYGDRMEILERHILRDSDNPILPKYEDFLVRNTQWYSKFPAYGDIQFASMHILGAQNTLKLIHNTIFYTQTKATIEEYAKYRPDVIVCTHYFLLYAAIEYKRKFDDRVLVVAYCPDNNVHGWWDVRTDVMYTNNPMATKQAYDLHFPSGHVREMFYATRSDVTASNESKEFYREKFKIPKDKFAVVIADGVYAKAKVKKVCLELLKTDVPLCICVLAGKNEKLRRYFEGMRSSVKPNVTLLTFGFIQEAPQLYGACDLFITKAGPNAILDSVMMGTPILTDYCASPIERATQKLFTEHYFCGYHIVSPRRIRKQVEKLVSHPELLEEIKKTLSFFDKSKNGAEQIADDIAELVWNREAHMERVLQEEERSIYDLMNADADARRKKGEKKIRAILSQVKQKIETLPPEQAKKLKRRAARKVSRISARTDKAVARLIKKAKKASKSVYDDSPVVSPQSRYSALVAKQKLERTGKPPEEEGEKPESPQ